MIDIAYDLSNLTIIIVINSLMINIAYNISNLITLKWLSNVSLKCVPKNSFEKILNRKFSKCEGYFLLSIRYTEELDRHATKSRMPYLWDLKG